MYSNVNKSLLLILGWIVQASYQIACLRCSSSIQLTSFGDDQPCLKGTLEAVTCPEPSTRSENSTDQCVSSLYRVGPGMRGVMINRDCIYAPPSVPDCDPEVKLEDLKGAKLLYCRYPCVEDGCNRHKVRDIVSNATHLSKFHGFLLLLYLYFLYLFNCPCY